MKIDPRISFYFGIWTSVLLLLGGSTIQLTNMIPDAWIPVVKAWAMNLGAINSVILTALHGYSGTGPGPLSAAPTVKEAQDVMDQARRGTSG